MPSHVLNTVLTAGRKQAAGSTPALPLLCSGQSPHCPPGSGIFRKRAAESTPHALLSALGPRQCARSPTGWSPRNHHAHSALRPPIAEFRSSTAGIVPSARELAIQHMLRMSLMEDAPGGRAASPQIASCRRHRRLRNAVCPRMRRSGVQRERTGNPQIEVVCTIRVDSVSDASLLRPTRTHEARKILARGRRCTPGASNRAGEPTRGSPSADPPGLELYRNGSGPAVLGSGCPAARFPYTPADSRGAALRTEGDFESMRAKVFAVRPAEATGNGCGGRGEYTLRSERGRRLLQSYRMDPPSVRGRRTGQRGSIAGAQACDTARPQLQPSHEPADAD
jgi:hypothetical protein